MLVRDVMSSNVHYCTLDQHAGDAVRLMELFDLGCVPVVDERMSPVAMITDRDIALASYRCKRVPQELEIRSVMSNAVFSCSPGDTIHAAERTMRDWQVRRLPVVDEEGCLCGMLSLNDIVLANERATFRLHSDLDHTLAAVCRHRERPLGVQS
jgi:CBS domain-containing protein